MKVPDNFEFVLDGCFFEKWLELPSTDELLCEIGHEIDIHYSLYFKDYTADKMYAHPLVNIIFGYWREIYGKVN